jgi:hypothetical protein
MKIRRERVSAAPAQACSRNVAHESTVTRPQSAASANIISNFPEADFALSIWPTSSKPVYGT